MFGTWRDDVENINKNLKELKNNNENNFKDLKKTLDNNSKTVTIPLSEYEELKEKVDYYEKKTHQLDYELNNMVDEFLQFVKDNGASPEIEEFTREEDKKIEKLNCKYTSDVSKLKVANKVDEIIELLNNLDYEIEEFLFNIDDYL